MELENNNDGKLLTVSFRILAASLLEQIPSSDMRLESRTSAVESGLDVAC